MLVKSSIFALPNEQQKQVIMKKIFYFIAALMMLTAVSCNKEEATVTDNNGNTSGGGSNPPASTIARATIGLGNMSPFENVLGIDVNGDGVLEYRIMDSEFEGSGLTFDSYNAENGTNVVTVSQTEWDHIATLSSNTVIGSNITNYGFYAYGDASFVYDIVPGTYYVGLRISLGDGIHYGWAKVAIAENGGSRVATWQECYYNTTVNASIQAGQKN